MCPVPPVHPSPHPFEKHGGVKNVGRGAVGMQEEWVDPFWQNWAEVGAEGRASAYLLMLQAAAPNLAQSCSRTC
eukprot:1156186-Pelagomonas_calceolata.AAC.8